MNGFVAMRHCSALVAILLFASGCQPYRMQLEPLGQDDDGRPILRWHVFPDREYAEYRARITDVCYDLRVRQVKRDVWPSQRSCPIAEIFRADGLPENECVLTSTLDPDADYLWSVRARFKLDDRTRVTPWTDARVVRGRL